MFVTDFVTLDHPIAEVRRRLDTHPSFRIAELAGAARDEAERMRLRVGPEIRGHQLMTHEVDVELGAPRHRGDRLVFSLRWRATGAEAPLLPDLDADLELAPLGDHACQITLNGRYEPPLSGVGKGLDRLLMHRIAQSSVRAFLHSLGDALGTSALTERDGNGSTGGTP